MQTTERIKSIRYTSEVEVTIDQVVDEANKIHAKVRAHKVTPADVDACAELLARMQREHPEFSKAYPIVIRYMCELQEYSDKALRRYLVGLKAKPYTSQDEYLDSQAEYITQLYKARTRSWTPSDVQAVRTNARSMLQREHDEFKSRVDAVDKEITERVDRLSKQSADELAEFVARAGLDDIVSRAGNIYGVTELPTGDIPVVVPADCATENHILADDLLAC